MSRMVHAYLNGSTGEAAKMQMDIVPMVNALFSDVNPIPVKEALNLLGWKVGLCRLPLCEMSIDGQARLSTVLGQYDLSFHEAFLAGGRS